MASQSQRGLPAVCAVVTHQGGSLQWGPAKPNLDGLLLWTSIFNWTNYMYRLASNTFRPEQNGCHFADSIFNISYSKSLVIWFNFHQSLFRVQLPRTSEVNRESETMISHFSDAYYYLNHQGSISLRIRISTLKSTIVATTLNVFTSNQKAFSFNLCWKFKQDWSHYKTIKTMFVFFCPLTGFVSEWGPCLFTHTVTGIYMSKKQWVKSDTFHARGDSEGRTKYPFPNNNFKI